MLKAENALLVVIDIQGKLASLMYDKEKFYDNCVRMIQAARVLEIPVIWNEQLPDKLGQTIDKIKAEFEGQTPLIKSSFSCCGNPEFAERLKSGGKKQVILIGMESHVCVYQTAIDLIAKNYEVYPVIDAISSRFPVNRQLGFDAMKNLGCKLTSVEMSLFEMLREATGEKFKKIVRIIK
jgi:nicotinamidase-related amidase